MVPTWRTPFFFVALALASLGRGPQAASPVPVLVELFTSEGCSDCPPADKVLDQLIQMQPASGAEVIGLGAHVDYWDRLGWKDRFSSAALTKRQRVYATRFANDSIYTPQMVVDGRVQFVGSDAAAARRAIGKAISEPHGVVRVTIEDVARSFPGRGDRGAESPALHVTVTVTDLPKLSRADRADIVVAMTEDGLRSDVKRGENKGRTLTHAAVARCMATIGEVTSEGPTSASATIPVAADWKRDQLKVVAFVQERRSRRILASAAVPLKNARP